ncbi:MAG: hypothetical protein ACOX5R_20780 [bacterium]
MKQKKESKKQQHLNEKLQLSLRTDYTPEELQKLLGDIESVISAHKAMQYGRNPENLVKTIRGGKVVWITVDEMNETLAKKRKLMPRKFIRKNDRENVGISSEIQRRIRTCQGLASVVKKFSSGDTSDLFLLLRNLELTHNRSVAHARELHLFEAAIQRKKQEVSIIQEMENVTTDMMNAIQNNELSDVEMYQHYYLNHLEEYKAKQKRLEPYINKARECRLEYLLTKRKLLLIQFQILQKAHEELTRVAKEILYYDRKGNISSPINQGLGEITRLLTQAESFIQTLEEYPPDQLEANQDKFQNVDRSLLTPLFDQMVILLEHYKEAWSTCFEQHPETHSPCNTLTPDTTAKTPERMAYQELLEKRDQFQQ